MPLWEFLLEILCDPQFSEVVSWTGNGWEFRISRPEILAQIWGSYKGFPKMNYDNLSRSLRQYYQRNIIQKTRGKTHAYQFTESVAMNKFNMAPQDVFNKFNVWPKVPYVHGKRTTGYHGALQSSSDYFPLDGANLHSFTPDGSTDCMTSLATRFKSENQSNTTGYSGSRSLSVDFDDAVCFPADLNQVKQEEFSDSDENV